VEGDWIRGPYACAEAGVVTKISCDVLIVGSGAAGGTLAATLAQGSSLSVVLVEKGGYYGAEFFNQRELDMTALLADRGARATTDGSIPVAGGQCVGGGTTVNYALSFNPVPNVWSRWHSDLGLEGFSLDPTANDYGVEGLNLAAAVADVRSRCNIHEPTDDQVNDNNQLFAAGCKQLGISARKFELNMRGCIGCGFCGQGCAYDAKQGTLVTYIQDSLRGGVRLVHSCTIDTIAFERTPRGLQAVGALGSVGLTPLGSRANSVPSGEIEFDAKVVIVCAGAIETPALLQRSQVPDPYDRIGRGLILHPSLPIAGVFDRVVNSYRGITGSYYSDHFYADKGFIIECLFDQPIDAALALPGFGARHFDLMRAYARLGGFGTMLVDSVTDSNRVTWNPSARGVDINYRLSEGDKGRLRFAAERMVEIMFAAGASEALLTSSERLTPSGDARFQSSRQAELCRRLEFIPNETLVTSAHAQASVKMGADPRQTMLSARGEVRGVYNLIVCDSSAFPTSCGANPMVSIMSMARYQGKRILAERQRYAGLA
jgi:choline dehydrogenase-like flavoprotein